MRATIDGKVIADAAESELITIEGNTTSPPSSLSAEAFIDSPTPYTCPWKGDAQYHDVSVAGSVHHDAAWSYPAAVPGLLRPGRPGLQRLRGLRQAAGHRLRVTRGLVERHLDQRAARHQGGGVLPRGRL